MAIVIEIEILNNGNISPSPKAKLDLVTSQIRAYLISKFPETEGFKMTEIQPVSGEKTAIGSVSYFRPISAIKYKMHESDKDGYYKFEIFAGRTTGSEVTITLDESSPPKFVIKVEWTSVMYKQLTNMAIGLAVILTSYSIIAACIERYQQDSIMKLLLYILLPWKLLWMAILALLITSIPAMITVWIVSKIIFYFGSNKFNKCELDSLSTEIVGLVKSIK